MSPRRALPSSDPRCKLALSALLFVAPLAAYRLPTLLLDYLAILAVAAASGALRQALRVQAPTAVIALVVAASEVAAGYGIPYAAATGLRFLDIVSASADFYLMTSADEVADVMRWIGAPEGAILWTVIALRFVPTLARDLVSVVESQASRGLGYRGFLDWIRGIPALVTPALVVAMVRGREVAEAIEIRGYRPGRCPSGNRLACAIALVLAPLLVLSALLVRWPLSSRT